MCGIVGIVGEHAEHKPNVLASMSARIAHRGPDDDGTWLGPSAALAHRRLSIIDLTSDGHQPMISDCGRYVLVFNGEIYNYHELRAELIALGERFRGNSDSEVLLIALRRWGSGALDRCNGMWAFALWDMHNRSLLAARDRFGKKPFYYAVIGDHLYFASEVKALLEVPGLRTEPDSYAIGDFCAERISDHGTGTFYTGVHQLLPAHILRWCNGALKLSCYWRLEGTQRGNYRKSDIDEIKALLESAVALRLRADTPVGCLLSGGLDSSAVTCLAQRLAERNNQTHVFSTVHAVSYEEAQGIDAVRTKFPQIRFHADQPDAASFWGDLDSVLWHQEQPFADASMVAHFGLMRLARQKGVPVLLSGQAADELFAGYPDHAWAYAGSRLRTGEIRSLVRYLGAALPRGPLPLKKLAYHGLPASFGALLRRSTRRKRLDWLAAPYQIVTEAAMRPSRRGLDPLDAVLLHAIDVATLPGFLHYEDRNSMAFGVETRLPFLDYRLAELMFCVPPAAKLAEARTKSLLRDAVTGIVPDMVRNRLAKTGYPAPLDRWLLDREDVLREAVARRDCPLIDYPRWGQHVLAFLGGSAAHLEQTWRGFVLIRWHARFFGNEAARV